MSAHQRLVIVRVNSCSSPEQLAFWAIYRKQDNTAMAAANRVLKQLEVFHLSGTLITEDGMRSLSRKLPSCKIDYHKRKPRYRERTFEQSLGGVSTKRDFVETL